MMNYNIGDFIKPNDEEYIYKITNIGTLSFGESYTGKSISRGHGRSFDSKATHYRLATEDEVEEELENAPKYFPFWVTNKKNVIISNGQIFAPTLERAKEIFNQKLIKMNNVGEYFMSEEPVNFLLN
jgi:hypothetical protein